jgi:hypothetical protein
MAPPPWRTEEGAMPDLAERSKAARLYEADFYAWAAQQAELLRERRFDELDLDHLIEEVADLGVSERNMVMSRARQIMQHFLKLQYSPAKLPRRGWKESIVTQRSDLEDVLTPSLHRELEGGLPHVYARARRDAAKDLRQDKVAERTLPTTCPYSLEQVLDANWLPENAHGIKNPAP